MLIFYALLNLQFMKYFGNLHSVSANIGPNGIFPNQVILDNIETRSFHCL